MDSFAPRLKLSNLGGMQMKTTLIENERPLKETFDAPGNPFDLILKNLMHSIDWKSLLKV